MSFALAFPLFFLLRLVEIKDTHVTLYTPTQTHSHTLPHTHTCIHLHGCLTGNWYLIKVQAQLLSVSRKTFPSAANRKLHSGKFSPPRGVTRPLSLSFFYDILVLHGTHWICLKWALLSRWTWNKQVEGCVWCSQLISASQSCMEVSLSMLYYEDIPKHMHICQNIILIML